MNNPVFMDALGWIGTVLYLIAYLLISLKKLEGDSLAYQGMNIVAGILLVINTFYWRAEIDKAAVFAVKDHWRRIGFASLKRLLEVIKFAFNFSNRIRIGVK